MGKHSSFLLKKPPEGVDPLDGITSDLNFSLYQGGNSTTTNYDNDGEQSLWFTGLTSTKANYVGSWVFFYEAYYDMDEWGVAMDSNYNVNVAWNAGSSSYSYIKSTDTWDGSDDILVSISKADEKCGIWFGDKATNDWTLDSGGYQSVTGFYGCTYSTGDWEMWGGYEFGPRIGYTEPTWDSSCKGDLPSVNGTYYYADQSSALIT